VIQDSKTLCGRDDSERSERNKGKRRVSPIEHRLIHIGGKNLKLKASDLASKMLLAGLGLAALTQEKAKKLLKELTGREKISMQDASAFVGELLTRGKETRKKLGELVKSEVAKILAKVDFASKKDLAELQKRVEELEAKLKG